MTNEPQNRSEEWLKTYAQQRRAEAAPHELHPATRRLLQAEVARTHARPAAAAVEAAPVEGVGLFGRWSFNALAISAVGVVAAVIGVLVSDSQQPRLAKFAGSPKSVSEAEIAKPDRFASPMEKPAATAAATTDKMMANLPFANTAAPVPPSTTAPAPQLNSITAVGGGGSAGGALSDLAKAAAPMKSVLTATQPSEVASSVSSVSANRPGGTIHSRTTKMTAPRSAVGELGVVPSGKLAGVKESAAKANAINEGVSVENAVATAKRTELSGVMRPVAASPGGPGQANFAARGAAEKAKKADADGQGVSYLQQNFSQAAAREQQAYRRNLNAPGEPRVLVNFQLEREGDTVRVVDGDGSVYFGNVVVEPGRKITPDARRKEAKEGPVKYEEPARDRTGQFGQEQSKVPAEAFNFQVIGTNRSLRQRVSFEGNYQMPGLPASEVKNAGNKDAAGNQRYFGDVKQQQIAPGPAPRVQGRAVIGNNRIEVDAVPVSK